MQITNQLDGNAERLDAVVLGTAIAKSYDASTGLLTLSGVDTLAHYQAVLRSLVYDNGSLNPSSTARVISVIVNDGLVDSLAANCVLTVVPVNNAPALDLNGPLVAGGNFAALYIEGHGAVVVVDATALTVTDPDNATLVSATASINARQDGAAELLDATVQGGIAKSYDAASGVLHLTGVAPLAAYQAVLRTLTYDNSASPPIGGNRQVTVVVNDGALDSPTVFCVLAVQARNHTPTLDALADRSVLENSGVLSVPLTGIGDGGDLVAQNLTVTATSSDPAILLAPSVVYTSAQPTGTLLLAPVANQAGTATVTVTVHDDGGTAFGSLDTFSRTFQLTIVPVNQRPSLATLADLVINEDDPVQTVQLAGISAGPANEAGQALTVTAISSRPDIIANPTVFYASPQAAGALQFTPLAHQSGVVTIFVQVADNGGTANGGQDRVARSFTVTVTPKSHVPVLVTDAGLTVPVHGAGVISYLALETQDFGPASSLVYHLSALPTDGLLELGGTALDLSGTFTQADINSGLLSYVHTGFVAGSDAFQFTVVNAQGNSLPVSTFPITISGAAVGTTPVVTLPGPAVTWVQGGGAVVLDGGATVSDASGTLAGGTLRITLIANGSAGRPARGAQRRQRHRPDRRRRRHGELRRHAHRHAQRRQRRAAGGRARGRRRSHRGAGAAAQRHLRQRRRRAQRRDAPRAGGARQRRRRHQRARRQGHHRPAGRPGAGRGACPAARSPTSKAAARASSIRPPPSPTPTLRSSPAAPWSRPGRPAPAAPTSSPCATRAPAPTRWRWSATPSPTTVRWSASPAAASTAARSPSSSPARRPRRSPRPCCAT